MVKKVVLSRQKNGLRQGNPLSPLNLVGDVLNEMIKKAAGKRHVIGLLGNCVPGDILALQYADVTLLFSSCDTRALRNLTIMLMLFEKVFGMKINFNKSEFIPLNLEDGQIHDIAHRGRVCVHMFIGMSAHTCMCTCVCTVFLKNNY
jgi:hypothetical protein